MEIIIVLKDAVLDKISLINTFNIGVESGCIKLIENNAKLDVSIGDFDSVTSEELELIKRHSKKHILLNQEKDYTDTYEAVKYAKNISDEVIILGGTSGSRIEHLYANINLLAKFDNVKIISDNNYIYVTKKCVNIKKDEYKYINLYALEEIKHITLEGFNII